MATVKDMRKDEMMICVCGHLKEYHGTIEGKTLCAHCLCMQFMLVEEDDAAPPPTSHWQPRAYIDRRRIPPPGGTGSPGGGTPTRSARVEMAYFILVHELLNVIHEHPLTDIKKTSIILAMKKAAGELS